MTDDKLLRYENLARNCAEASSEAVTAVKSLVENLKNSKGDKNGVSLLTVKNYEMMAYMGELVLLMSKMMDGDSIAEDESVRRALKHRVILEKIRPVEDKMKPQIEKLLNLKADESGKDKLRFLFFSVNDDSGEESDHKEKTEDGEKSKKYVPPKIRAMHYEDEEERPNKMIEKAKRRALQSSLIRELKQQYSDAPEEIREVSDSKFEYDRAREKYEEQNFKRVRMNKEQKRKSAKLGREETLNDLLDFGNYMIRAEEGRSKSGLKRKRVDSSNDGARRKLHKRDKKKIKDAKVKHKKKMIRKRQ
ncbi:unnamed protein product [Caenorhabditis auriculariae]|uniref:Uncharacterized protein n=1 Tax=Caenorhabditis auriculariae TaxID=2777116 RepID=A0A8S1HPZ8_9PELO|nr:unnamed protein product [Caenorhabditis auriculariae]